MELTYMVRGADGKQYGPATLELLGTWIREGRLPAQQEVKRSDMEHWAPAHGFQELQPLFASTANPPATSLPGGATPAVLPAPAAAAAATLKSSASWFYWIAGLSLINSIAAVSGGSWRFIIGLGITQVFDGFGSRIGSTGKLVALGLDILVAGVFILFGVFAHKRQAWAFIVGMVLFALDGLLMFGVQDWLGLAFHAFVLFCLFRGLKVCKELKTP